MNTKALEKRINRDLERTKKDIAVLKEDAVSGLNRRIEDLAEETRKTTSSAVTTLNKSIGRGLNQYNAKVHGMVDTVPGNLNKKVAGYPWVAVTASIILGVALGAMLKSGRPPLR